MRTGKASLPIRKRISDIKKIQGNRTTHKTVNGSAEHCREQTPHDRYLIIVIKLARHPLVVVLAHSIRRTPPI